MRRIQGFTLIEMVMVIVLLGILAGVLAPLIINLINGYQLTRTQADLTARGRLAMERIVREVRHAAPGTLRTVGGGAGIEFIRSRTGGIYVHESDSYGGDFSDMAKRFPITAAARTDLYALVDNTTFSVNAGELLVIGNTSPATFTAGGHSATLNGTTATTVAADGTLVGLILNFDAYTFSDSYSGRRFVIADQVVDIGRHAGTNTLRWNAAAIAAGATPSYDNLASWGAGNPILIGDVSAATFTFNPGGVSSTGVLQIALTLTANGSSVQLYQEVQVRNTP